MSLSALFCGEELGEMNSVSDQPPSVDAPPADEGTIISLIDSETHHMPHPDYLHLCRQRPIDVTARQDAIKWILRVHEYYQFRPVTAFLSVNYFDRFLSIHSLPVKTLSFKLLIGNVFVFRLPENDARASFYLDSSMKTGGRFSS